MPYTPRNILIVEDEPNKALALTTILNRLDYNVFVEDSPTGCIKLLNNIVPNVVLLDGRLPLIEGTPLYKKLRSEVRFSNIKIITLGGLSDKTFLEETLLYGADEYLFYPIKLTFLYRTIQNLIESKPRNAPRLRVVFMATIVKENLKMETFITMLSEESVFARTPKPFPSGTRVRITLGLPSKSPITVDGLVTYSIEPGNISFHDPGMGITFIDTGSKFTESIRLFVENFITEGIDEDLIFKQAPAKG